MATGGSWPLDDPKLTEVVDIIAKETAIERERLLPDATMVSLDIASLDLVQAIFAIETRFGVEIPVVSEGGDAEFATLGALVRHAMQAIERGTPV